MKWHISITRLTDNYVKFEIFIIIPHYGKKVNFITNHQNSIHKSLNVFWLICCHKMGDLNSRFYQWFCIIPVHHWSFYKTFGNFTIHLAIFAEHYDYILTVYELHPKGNDTRVCSCAQHLRNLLHANLHTSIHILLLDVLPQTWMRGRAKIFPCCYFNGVHFPTVPPTCHPCGIFGFIRTPQRYQISMEWCKHIRRHLFICLDYVRQTGFFQIGDWKKKKMAHITMY